jgi:hypothetical protein
MTAEEVVGYLLEGEGLDVLRESLLWVVQQLMEAEVKELIGAGHGERAPAQRLTHRNGDRSRPWSTRAGELELAIPKLRGGSYFPSFLEPRRRSEPALVSVVQEAYVAGVSTRKVDQVVESLGLRISKSEVSRICVTPIRDGGADELANIVTLCIWCHGQPGHAPKRATVVHRGPRVMALRGGEPGSPPPPRASPNELLTALARGSRRGRSRRFHR